MKILVAVENARDGYRLVDYLAERNVAGDQFLLLTVVEPSSVDDYGMSVYGGDAQRQILELRITHANKFMERIKTYLTERLQTQNVSGKVIVGAPKLVLLQVAKEWGADEVVLGAHNKNCWDQFLLGSVSAGVASAAPCTVAVVK